MWSAGPLPDTLFPASESASLFKWAEESGQGWGRPELDRPGQPSPSLVLASPDNPTSGHVAWSTHLWCPWSWKPPEGLEA